MKATLKLDLDLATTDGALFLTRREGDGRSSGSWDRLSLDITSEETALEADLNFCRRTRHSQGRTTKLAKEGRYEEAARLLTES